VEAKTQKRGTIKTSTKTAAHNRLREKIGVYLHNHKTLPCSEDNPEWCFYHNTYGERAGKCKQPCSFNLDRPNVQQLHSEKLNKSSTDPFADMYNTHWCYYHNQYGDRAHNCTFPCSYIKDNSSHSQYSKKSPYRHSDTLFWVRDKISNRIFSLHSVLRATPTLIQRAKRDDREFRSAGGHQLRSYGVVEEEIDIGFGPQVWSFYVLQTQCPLLGKDFFQHNFLSWKIVPDDGSRTIKCRNTSDKTGASIVVTDDYVARNTVAAVRVSQKRFHDVLAEFPSIIGVLDRKTPCKYPFEHHIPTTGRSCFARAREVAPKHAALERQKINDMLASGVLERASGPYASPMHIVPKDGGKDIRIVGDFRALNQSIVKDTYQIPRILEFQNKMKDAKIFSTLDLKSGFHQILLSKEDRKKTTLCTPWGSFHYTRCCFGLSNSPQSMQRLTD